MKFVEVKQQQNEPTGSFICRKRLLLSQLKQPPGESIPLNMVYGLLNIKIRDRVHRESIGTFKELISASRELEMFLFETQSSTTNPKDEKKTFQIRTVAVSVV